AKEGFRVEEVDSESIRLGTRRDDVEVRYRRDAPLSIPVGTDRLISQLIAAVERVTEKLVRLTPSLPLEIRADLAEAEREMLGVVLHPLAELGRDPNIVRQAAWAADSVRGFAFPASSATKVPSFRLTVPTKRV